MKGYTIDCNYLVNVNECMKKEELPFPRKRNTISIGDEELSVIRIETMEECYI